MTKRFIDIIKNDGTESTKLEIGKYTVVNSSKKDFIYLDKMTDGRWLLACSESVIPDMSKIDSLKIIRYD